MQSRYNKKAALCYPADLTFWRSSYEKNQNEKAALRLCCHLYDMPSRRLLARTGQAPAAAHAHDRDAGTHDRYLCCAEGDCAARAECRACTGRDRAAHADAYPGTHADPYTRAAA